MSPSKVQTDSMITKVEPTKTNNNRKTNTIYHILGASKCMHVVHSVGFAIAVDFGWFYLRFTQQNSYCITKFTMKHLQNQIENQTSPSLVTIIRSALRNKPHKTHLP